MKKLSYLKYTAALLPALALGMPAALTYANDTDKQRADQHTQTSEHSRTRQVSQAGYLSTRPEGGFHTDKLIGAELKNRRNNESIGEVSQLVLDKDGQVVAAIVSIGGMLGVGARDVAFGWDQIERKLDGDKLVLSVDLAEGSLDNAPVYGSAGAALRTRTTGMTAPDRNRQLSGPSETTPNSEYVENKPARGFHSDSLVGQNIKNQSNKESVGTINNLLLDHDGQIIAAVISVGGFMGVGAHNVAISWNQIERRIDNDDDTTLWTSLTSQNLTDAPRYSSKRLVSQTK